MQQTLVLFRDLLGKCFEFGIIDLDEDQVILCIVQKSRLRENDLLHLDARPAPVGASEVEEDTFVCSLCGRQSLFVIGLPFRSAGDCRDEAESDQKAGETAYVHSRSYRSGSPRGKPFGGADQGDSIMLR